MIARGLTLLLLFGCAGCGALNSTGPSGINEVRVSKQAGQAPVTTRRPIMQTKSAPAAVRAASQELAAHAAQKSASIEGPLGWEAGPTALLIVTHLRTAFSSPVPGLDWNHRAMPAGTGVQASMKLPLDEADGESILGLTAGRAYDKRQTESRASGGVFARETIETEVFWAAVDYRHYPVDWGFFKAATGIFVYSLESRLYTDAPAYNYSGLSGLRFLGAFGLGGGLETPWAFPLKLGVEAAWWFAGDEDIKIESGVLQAGAHARLKF